MNKKLKIYSGLFLATLLVLIVTNVFHFNKSITTYSSNDEKLPFVFGIISSVLGMIITIWILVMVFILIHSIRKGNVFVAQVSKYLEITGILLSVKYVYNWIISYIIQHYLINHVRMAGYDIVYKYESASIYIIIGLALLIISQIILMGKDLKEDVDLTV